MNRIELKDRYVIVADIVGFKQIVNKENKGVIDAIVDNFFTMIKEADIKLNQIEKCGIISDTIYLVFNENADLNHVFFFAFCLMTRMPMILVQGGISKGTVVICEEKGNIMIMGDAYIRAHNFTEKYPIGMFLDYSTLFNMSAKDSLSCKYVDIYFDYYLLSLPNHNNEEVLYMNFVRNFNYGITELYQFIEALQTYYINASDEQKIRKFIICFLMLSMTNYIELSINKNLYAIHKKVNICQK